MRHFLLKRIFPIVIAVFVVALAWTLFEIFDPRKFTGVVLRGYWSRSDTLVHAFWEYLGISALMGVIGMPAVFVVGRLPLKRSLAILVLFLSCFITSLIPLLLLHDLFNTAPWERWYQLSGSSVLEMAIWAGLFSVVYYSSGGYIAITNDGSGQSE